eukprot:10901331-Lingulodinium_polyedra.AAC.1
MNGATAARTVPRFPPVDQRLVNFICVGQGLWAPTAEEAVAIRLEGGVLAQRLDAQRAAAIAAGEALPEPLRLAMP